MQKYDELGFQHFKEERLEETGTPRIKLNVFVNIVNIQKVEDAISDVLIVVDVLNGAIVWHYVFQIHLLDQLFHFI